MIDFDIKLKVANLRHIFSQMKTNIKHILISHHPLSALDFDHMLMEKPRQTSQLSKAFNAHKCIEWGGK